jgi:4-amino-4-deoxy-L-arabinose transferase-like glycosyltransferase
MRSPSERQTALVVIGASIFLFVALLLAMPARFHGFDEAKYLGIGLNVLNGHGAVTVYGGFFEPHSPLWPAIMAAPRAWFDLDAYAWAHLLNVASAGLVLVLGAVFGWRIRPAAGALTAASLLAFPYVFELSRRVGLDMPAALLTLAYLLVGWAAVRRGSARWGVAAGALLAVAFLVKETVLPFAPVPFLAGFAWGRPATAIARTAASAIAAAAVGTSWWWILYAVETGRVYRLGTPAITLVPLAIVIVLAVAAGFAWEPIASRLSRGRSGDAQRRGASISPRTSAWTLAVLWTLALVIFMARSRELLGHGLFDPAQIAFYVGSWYDQLLPVVAVGGIGAAIDLARRGVAGWRPGPPVDGLWMALLCGLPTILLVIGVGDAPRHYVPQLVMLIAIGSGGWIWLVERVVERPTPARVAVLALAAGAAIVALAPLVVGRRLVLVGLAGLVLLSVATALVVASRRDRRARASAWLRSGGVSLVLVGLAFVVGAGALLARTTGSRSDATADGAKAQAVGAVANWLRGNMPAGSTVAFGSALGFETAVEVQDDFRVVQIRNLTDVVFDAAAPLAVTRPGRSAADDWVALSALSRTASTFTGYAAITLADQIRRSGADAWVLITADAEEDPLLVDRALTPDHGFDLRARWTWPTGAGTLEALIFGIRRADVAFGTTLWASEAALARLVDQLAAAHTPSVPGIARALLARVSVVPEGPAADGLRARLRTLAGD